MKTGTAPAATRIMRVLAGVMMVQSDELLVDASMTSDQLLERGFLAPWAIVQHMLEIVTAINECLQIVDASWLGRAIRSYQEKFLYDHVIPKGQVTDFSVIEGDLVASLLGAAGYEYDIFIEGGGRLKFFTLAERRFLENLGVIANHVTAAQMSEEKGRMFLDGSMVARGVQMEAGRMSGSRAASRKRSQEKAQKMETLKNEMKVLLLNHPGIQPDQVKGRIVAMPIYKTWGWNEKTLTQYINEILPEVRLELSRTCSDAPAGA